MIYHTIVSWPWLRVISPRSWSQFTHGKNLFPDHYLSWVAWMRMILHIIVFLDPGVDSGGICPVRTCLVGFNMFKLFIHINQLLATWITKWSVKLGLPSVGSNPSGQEIFIWLFLFVACFWQLQIKSSMMYIRGNRYIKRKIIFLKCGIVKFVRTSFKNVWLTKSRQSLLCHVFLAVGCWRCFYYVYCDRQNWLVLELYCTHIICHHFCVACQA